MPNCDCCQNVIPRLDPEAVTLTYFHRTILLCRHCNRVVLALLADMKLSPPLDIIQ